MAPRAVAALSARFRALVCSLVIVVVVNGAGGALAPRNDSVTVDSREAAVDSHDDDVAHLAASYASRRPCLVPVTELGSILVDNDSMVASVGPWFVGDITANDTEQMCIDAFTDGRHSVDAVAPLLPRCHALLLGSIDACDATVRELQRELEVRACRHVLW
jgi:hypothetical protein